MKKHLLSSLAYLLLLLSAFPSCSEQEAPNLPAPILTIEEEANVTGRTSATISGVISRQAGTKIAECGFLYSTVSTVPLEESTIILLPEDANGTLSVQLTDLLPNTTYYYCLYASSGYMTIRSDISQFTTDAGSVPTLDEITCSEVTAYTASVSCRLLDNGGHEITSIGFCYKKIEDGYYELPTVGKNEGSNAINLSPSSTYLSATLDGLQPESDYVIRAFAINKEYQEVGYSNAITIHTLNGITISTGDAYNITDVSAEVSGTITAENYGVIRTRGVLYSTNPDPTASGNTRIEDRNSSGGNISATLQDLEIGTTYYYCAFAETSYDNMEYGDIKSFTTTITKPVFDKPIVESIKDKTATARVNVSNNVELGHYGYEISTNALPDEQFGSNTQIVYGEGYSGYDFIGKLTDLQPSTTYYLRAWAERGKGNQNATTIDPTTANMDYYAFSETITFTTAYEAGTPTVANIQVIDIQKASISLGMDITGNGNYEISEAGFCYTTDPSKLPTIEENERYNHYSGNTHVEGTIYYLTPNTTYYIRGYAYNGYETGYTEVITVTTMDSDSVPNIDDNPSPGIE